MKRLTINLLVMFLTMALGIVVTALRSGSFQAPLVDRATEEYAVDSGLLNSFQCPPGVDLLLVANQAISTVPQNREVDEKEFIKYHLPATAKETLDDYKLFDGQPLNIANRFTLNGKYILISNQEVKSYFENSNSLLRFREKYPS
jgi:hypothetical protein